MCADVVFKECDTFMDDNLLQEIGQGLESCGDDLQRLFDSVDIEASINTEDLISNLPHDLDIPIFDGGVQDVFKEDIWKDGSDGSDSGIDCLSIKHEPMSPTSSNCSDFSDSVNSQNALMDYSPNLPQFSEHSETSDLFSQFDLGSLGSSTEPLYLMTPDSQTEEFIKSELPDTPPLTPHADQHPLIGSVQTPEQGFNVAGNVKCVNNSTNNTLNSSAIDGGHNTSTAARAITFVANKPSNGSKNMVTVNKSVNGGPIKVVLPVSHTQNGRVKKIVNTSKVKIQPRPAGQHSTGSTVVPNSSIKTTKVQTLPQGKPLVLTPEEFAKLTAQGVLKLEPSQSTTATAPVSTATKITLPTSSLTTASRIATSNATNHTNLATASVISQKAGATVSKSITLPAGFPVTSGCGPVTDIDLKSWKRQQRMIKNRESACLSRKRKKEYLSTVEEKLQEYTHQNEKLKSENHNLKRRLEQLAKENEALRNRVPRVGSVKKAAISLLAVALFLTLNLSPLTSILSSSDQSLPSLSALPAATSHHSRHLMSLDDSGERLVDSVYDISKATYNINDIEATVNAWKKSVEFGRGFSGGQGNSKGTEVSEGLMLMKEVERLKLSLSTMCPMYYNSTESKRLTNEITGWFLGQKEELRRKDVNTQDTQERLRVKKAKKLYHPKKVGTSELDSFPSEFSDPAGRAYELQVFTGHDNKYERFMDAIHRRNDTFYVVSFRRDQLLLPATATNNSMGRPRMSLVMPAMGLNESMQPSPGNIAMMQIDCEVMATNVLHIEKNAVPEKMMENGTFFMPPSPTQTEVPPSGKNGQQQTTRGKNHLPRDRSRT